MCVGARYSAPLLRAGKIVLRYCAHRQCVIARKIKKIDLEIKFKKYVRSFVRVIALVL